MLEWRRQLRKRTPTDMIVRALQDVDARIEFLEMMKRRMKVV
jgi:hypothetical protein